MNWRIGASALVQRPLERHGVAAVGQVGVVVDPVQRRAHTNTVRTATGRRSPGSAATTACPGPGAAKRAISDHDPGEASHHQQHRGRHDNSAGEEQQRLTGTEYCCRRSAAHQQRQRTVRPPGQRQPGPAEPARAAMADEHTGPSRAQARAGGRTTHLTGPSGPAGMAATRSARWREAVQAGHRLGRHAQHQRSCAWGGPTSIVTTRCCDPDGRPKTSREVRTASCPGSKARNDAAASASAPAASPAPARRPRPAATQGLEDPSAPELSRRRRPRASPRRSGGMPNFVVHHHHPRPARSGKAVDQHVHGLAGQRIEFHHRAPAQLQDMLD